MTHATEWMALRDECERLAQENARLREALRDIAIVGEGADAYCLCCGIGWMAGKPERHVPGCLASMEGT